MASWRHLVDLAADMASRDAAMILAGVMDAADTIDDSVVCAWATKPPAQTPRALTEPPASHAQHQSADDGDQPTLF